MLSDYWGFNNIKICDIKEVIVDKCWEGVKKDRDIENQILEHGLDEKKLELEFKNRLYRIVGGNDTILFTQEFLNKRIMDILEECEEILQKDK